MPTCQRLLLIFQSRTNCLKFFKDVLNNLKNSLDEEFPGKGCEGNFAKNEEIGAVEELVDVGHDEHQ